MAVSCKILGGIGMYRHLLIEESKPFAITGVVVTEVLQGLTRDVTAIERLLANCDTLEPEGFETYRHAAVIYRAARAKGVTLTTIDTLIAAIAVEHGVKVFTLDQDFAHMARVTAVELYRF